MCLVSGFGFRFSGLDSLPHTCWFKFIYHQSLGFRVWI
jgi:hypothetical protein